MIALTSISCEELFNVQTFFCKLDESESLVFTIQLSLDNVELRVSNLEPLRFNLTMAALLPDILTILSNYEF